ncbi:MAG: hypothetical protein HQL47_10505 [Gammaproteobacteria bacterium]|nr:hypothetical protein [Gammaproteobacteria bacterium]
MSLFELVGLDAPILNEMDNRVAEASALRRFFQEQWDSLQQLLEDYRQQQAAEERRVVAVGAAVESIVEGTDRRLRVLSDYKDALRDSARELLEYIEEIVAALPPALPVSKRRLTTDPLLRRLIRSRDQIDELFLRNREIRAFFADPEHQQCDAVYALLFVLRYEKRVLGTEMRGDMLMREVPQTAVNFTGRELLAPRPSEEAARKALKQVLFDSVVAHAKRQILFKREALSEKERLQAQLHPEQNLNNPEVYLHLLRELLSSPRQLLQLHNAELQMNSLDILLGSEAADSSQSGDRLQFFEVGVGAERSRVVSLLSYPRAEFQAG